MATSNDLFLAILALDAYNRGYHPGLSGLTGTQIGTATITSQEYSAVQVAADFYAVAYSWNGQTVISYRGTEFEGSPSLGDLLNGWTLSLGNGSASQPQLAKDFYLITQLPARTVGSSPQVADSVA
jgi:hypothetical protein